MRQNAAVKYPRWWATPPGKILRLPADELVSQAV